MRRLLISSLVVIAAACADDGPVAVSPSDPAAAGLGTPVDASRNAIDIAVIGDVPYGSEATSAFPAFIEAINADPGVRRTVHVGDIKSGSTVCSDEWFDFMRARLDDFADPLVYTPGDNEWTDCHRANNGAYDPLERLARIREVFFDAPGSSLGRRTKRVLSQPGLPENQLWFESQVVFAAIHQVGSNNGLLPWTGLTEPTPGQLAEVDARSAANREWLDESFDLALDRDARGVVLFVHADMFRPGDTPADVTGHRAFVELMAERAAAYGGPVLLVVGDSHTYRELQPLVGTSAYGTFDVPNLTMIVVEESLRGDMGEWLRLTVDPGDPEVFSWERVR